MKSDSAHWNRIFRETADQKLGWYEHDLTQTFRLLNQIPQWQTSTVFLPGAGTSRLVEVLLEAGTQLMLNDISPVALDHVKQRLGENADSIDWICQDIARSLGTHLPPIDLWIDRAVLHFLTETEAIQGYFTNVRAGVKVGGHVLFAEFPPHGVPKCAGLDLHRYSLEELTERLGDGFMLVDHFECTYMNPAGKPRPYIYALYQREKETSSS